MTGRFGKVLATGFRGAVAGLLLASCAPDAIPLRSPNTLPPDARIRLGAYPPFHAHEVHGLAFSPDGRFLATTGRWDEPVVLWDAASGDRRFDFRIRDWSPKYPKKELCTSLAFSPDGIAVAATLLDHSLCVWNAADGKEWFHVAVPGGPCPGIPMPGDPYEPFPLAWSPDGRALATAGGDRTVRLRDARTGKETRQELCDYAGSIKAIAFAPDGRRLAVAGDEPAVFLLDLADRSSTRGVQEFKTGFPVRSVAFPRGKALLAAGCAGGQVLVWNAETGKRLHALEGGQREVASVAFSPAGDLLAVGGARGDGASPSLVVWDMVSGRKLHEFPAELFTIQSIAFSPDGGVVAAGGTGQRVRLWDVQTGKPAVESPGHEHPVTAAAFSDDGKTALTAAYDGLFLWDVETGKRLEKWKENPLAFSRDGKVLVYDSPTSVRVVGVPSGTVWLDRVPTLAIALSDDGRLVAASGAEKVSVREVATGREIRPPIPVAQADFLRFSPNGGLLGVAQMNGGAWIWDLRSGREVLSPGRISAMAFSPDGKRLASVDRSSALTSSLNVWEIGPGRKTSLDGELPCSPGLNDVAFSPDGRLVGWTNAGEVRLYDAKSGKLLRAWRVMHGDSKPVLIFSPDGKKLAAGDYTSLLVWDVPSENMQAK